MARTIYDARDALHAVVDEFDGYVDKYIEELEAKVEDLEAKNKDMAREIKDFKFLTISRRWGLTNIFEAEAALKKALEGGEK